MTATPWTVAAWPYSSTPRPPRRAPPGRRTPKRDSPLTTPVATYRLQFNRDFRFADARAVVPYLHDLGITHLYASPVFAARPGSAHGYDVTDPARLNPELGTEKDFEELVAELKGRGMGLLLDIVPNHMAAEPDNPWWADVLEHGRNSRYAPYFDIDWDAHPEGKVVLPILGAPLDEVLRRGDLTVSLGVRGPSLRYGQLRLPVSSPTPAVARRANRHPARMRALLAEQAYELAHWRDGVRRLNYRRFFDISGLAGVRVEDPAVFDAVHGLTIGLARQGTVTGLRVDHIDGLRDPLAYLQRLRRAISRKGPAYPVLVEKILLGDEELPPEWPCAGTTGYEFANAVNALFVDPRGLDRLRAAYRRFTGLRADFGEVVYDKKRMVITELFPGELRDLTLRLHGLAGAERLDEADLAEALVEVSACLPVYRTYTRRPAVSRRDRDYIEESVRQARRRNPGLDAAALDLLRRVLLLETAPSLPAEERRRRLEFVLRWQQFTGPATAKGLEDTALYSYNRLVSLNDVGGDPGGAHVADAVRRFHRRCADTLKRRPHTLNATSTHDTKRSEDVRARIDVLSEMPLAWARRLNHWHRMNLAQRASVDGRAVPDPHEEALLYQTLIGAWPLETHAAAGFVDRMKAYVIKAAREAKANTSWLDPDAPYEGALARFVERILDPSRPGPFLDDFLRFQDRIASCGALNSLAQTLIKIAAPGVPDFYRGAELWDLSLVDPDNRRPVDFARRSRLLDEVLEPEPEGGGRTLTGLLADWRSGRIKMYVTAKALAFRGERADLFRSARYVPLEARGERREHVFAFARARGRRWAVVAVPRLVAALCPTPRPWLRPAAWNGTALLLPPRAPASWLNVLTGETVAASPAASGRMLDCRDLFRRLPVALLTGLHR